MTSLDPLMTRETVALDTPANLAISRILLMDIAVPWGEEFFQLYRRLRLAAAEDASENNNYHSQKAVDSVYMPRRRLYRRETLLNVIVHIPSAKRRICFRKRLILPKIQKESRRAKHPQSKQLTFAPPLTRALGIQDSVLVRLAQRGRLERMSRGVYRIAHFPADRLAQYREAVLWAQASQGPECIALSHVLYVVLRHVLFNMGVGQQAFGVSKANGQIERLGCVRLLHLFEVGEQHLGLTLEASIFALVPGLDLPTFSGFVNNIGLVIVRRASAIVAEKLLE